MQSNGMCPCNRNKTIRYFCVQQGCKKHLLCADCNDTHKRQNNPHDIRELGLKNSLRFSINSENLKKEIMAFQLSNTINTLQQIKNKLIEDVEKLKNYYQNAFQQNIQKPLELLYGTKDDVQEKAVKCQINDPSVKQQRLQEIARQSRFLSCDNFKKSQWVREYCELLIEQFWVLKQQMEKKLNLLITQNMQSLVNNAYMKMKIREEQRIKFINRFGKKVLPKDQQPHFASLIQLPNESHKLNGIEELTLTYCNLTYIPEQLHLFKELKNLSLRYNQIQQIKNLEDLTKLQILSIAQNRIKKIENLQNLKNLKQLYLQANPIFEIPDLSYLQKLQTLALDTCKIKKLENVDNLANLKCFYIYHNPLIGIQQEVQKIIRLKQKGIIVHQVE